MKQSFTQLDLIRYLYAELDETSSVAVLEWILSDRKRTDRFEALAESKNLLSERTYSPSVSTIHQILSFSENRALEAHR